MISTRFSRIFSSKVVLCTAVVFVSQLTFAETVRVISEEANVMLGREILATVKAGDLLDVIRRKGDWLGVKVKTEQGERTGWILARHVKADGVEALAPADAEPGAEGTFVPSIMGQPLKVGEVEADYVAMLQYNGASPAIKGTALNAIWKESDCQEFLKRPLASLQQLSDMQAQRIGMKLYKLLPLLKSQIIIKFHGLTPQTGPKALLAVKTGEAGSPVHTAIQELINGLKVSAPPGVLQEAKIGDVNVITLNIPGTVVRGAFVEGWFLAGLGGAFQEALEDPLAALPKDPVTAIAAPESKSVFTLFYNNATGFKMFGPMIPKEVRESGLESIKWAYLDIRPHGRGYKTVAVVSADPEKSSAVAGFLKGGKPVSVEVLKKIPKNCRFFSVSSINLGESYDRVVNLAESRGEKELKDLLQRVKEFEVELGFEIRNDLLASLGNEMIMITQPGGLLFIPSFVIDLELVDADKFDHCVASAVTYISKLAQEGNGRPGFQPFGSQIGLQLTRSQFNDVTINVLNIQGAPIPLSPCYAIIRDRLYVALFPHMLKDYLLFLKQGGPDIRANQDFRFVRSHLPENVSSLYYGDLKSSVNQLYTLLPMAVAALNGVRENPIKFDTGSFPAWATVARHLFGTAGVSYKSGDALVFEIYSPLVIPVAGGDVNMTSLATTSILVAMLLPAVSRARGEARSMSCKNNLKQLAIGAIQYVDVFGKGRHFPKKLSIIYTSKIVWEPEVYACPADVDPQKIAEGLESSYESAFDRAGFQILDRMPSNYIMIWERKPTHRGIRNAAFFDGHVENMSETRFQDALSKLDKFIKENQPKEAAPAPK